MGIERRLEKLEANATGVNAQHDAVPMEVRVQLKAVRRYHARAGGEDPPPYSQEEIEELRRDDLETAAGEAGRPPHRLRDDPGWQSEESRELLEAWEEDARRRLAKAEDLPPERWCEVWGEVYEHDEDNEEERNDL